MDWREIPSLSALRAFEAAARHGSYSAAARELNVSHAAIAQHVRGLESHFGQSLMQRDGRGMATTAAGQSLAESVAGGFAEIANGVRQLNAEQEAGPLRLTTTRTFAENWLMPRLAGFWQTHPEIALAVSANDDVVDLRRSEYHLAIRYGCGDWPGLESTFLTSARNVIVAHPSLLEEVPGLRAQDRASFKQAPWLVDRSYGEFIAWLALHDLDIDRLNARELDGNSMVLAATRAGAGASVQPEAVVEADLASGRLVALLRDEKSALGYHLVRLPGPVPDRVRRFTRWMRAEIAAE